MHVAARLEKMQLNSAYAAFAFGGLHGLGLMVPLPHHGLVALDAHAEIGLTQPTFPHGGLAAHQLYGMGDFVQHVVNRSVEGAGTRPENARLVAFNTGDPETWRPQPR